MDQPRHHRENMVRAQNTVDKPIRPGEIIPMTILMTRFFHQNRGCGPLALLATAALVATIPTAAAADDVESGRKLAQTHCARCHVIGDFNKYGGIGSTPSFQLLVRRRPDYRARFETFFERPPHPAFVTVKGYGRRMAHLPANAAPVTLPLQAINDILAFAETLK